MDGVSPTFVLLELPLHKAELFFGLPQVLPESDDLSYACNSGQQQRLLINIDKYCQTPAD